MSEKGWLILITRPAVAALLLVGINSVAFAATWQGTISSIDGSDGSSIDGSDLLSIDGSDGSSIDGSDLLSIDGSDGSSIDGSDLLSIDGSDGTSIDGSDLLSIDGSDGTSIGETYLVSIDGSDGASIDGSDGTSIDVSDLLSIDGSDGTSVFQGRVLSIDGSDGSSVGMSDLARIAGSRTLNFGGSHVLSIDGKDVLTINVSNRLSIDGSDSTSIDGSDRLAIDGVERVGSGDVFADLGASESIVSAPKGLLALGQVDAIGDGFISVLGQTVFGGDSEFAGVATGETVAVYGSIDAATGGFVNTRIVSVSPTGVDSSVPSFLRGTVDAVDATLGRAVVSGMTVDYNAMLSRGDAPRVGDLIAVSGRSYRDLGLLVADPTVDLDAR